MALEIEFVPEPAADDPAARAAVAALTRGGLLDDLRPDGSTGAWRRAGVSEAVERGVSPGGGVVGKRDAAGAAPSGSAAPV